MKHIKLNIDIGDTLLGGRWRNKQVKVKKIGKDENGQITVNGKPLLKFRVWKDLPKAMRDKYKLKENQSIKESKLQDDVSNYLAHLSDSGFEIEVSDLPNLSERPDLVGRSQVRIYKPAPKYSNTKHYSYDCPQFNWSEIEEEIIRFISMILDEHSIDYTYCMAKDDHRHASNSFMNRDRVDYNDILNGKTKIDMINSFVIGLISNSDIVEEKLNRDLYNPFIDRYRKTGYISTTNIKRMDNMGITYDEFMKIQSDVDKCFNFFEKNDLDVLREILTYEHDMPPGAADGFIWFSIDANVGSLDRINIVASLDDKDLPSKEHKKLCNKLDVTEAIIERIDDGLNAKFDHYKKRQEEEKLSKTGYKDTVWTSYMLKDLKKIKPYKVNISPVISIQFKLDFGEYDDDYYNYNSERNVYKRDSIERHKNILKGDEVIGRYLRAIGYSDVQYTINESYQVWLSMAEYKITINI